MIVKKLTQEKKPVDVSEWNEEIKAFIRPLDSFETIRFYDLYYTFVNESKTTEERWGAAFDAAKFLLVDEADKPLLQDEDRAAIRKAAFLPLRRIFNAALESTQEIETTKKN